MYQNQTLEKIPNIHYENEYLSNYQDTATWAAEAIDGQMRTSFEFNFDGDELYAKDGRILREVFEAAIEDARYQAAINPDLAFEISRRETELEEYKLMVGMARGELPNTMIVTSDYPHALMNSSKDVGGYNSVRRQTMQRTITTDEQGNIKITTQSLDGSNRQALERIYHSLGYKPQQGELLGQRIHMDLTPEEQLRLPDLMTDMYDESLKEQFGGQWFAGRQPKEILNTYDFVLRQHDLISEFTNMRINGLVSEDSYYNLAAAIQNRLDTYRNPSINLVNAHFEFTYGDSISITDIQREMIVAGQLAKKDGRTFSGCGMSVGGEQTAEEQLGELGYGNKTEATEDKYGPLSFKCPKGHYNTRPRNKLIERCKTCGTSVKC